MKIGRVFTNTDNKFSRSSISMHRCIVRAAALDWVALQNQMKTEVGRTELNKLRIYASDALSNSKKFAAAPAAIDFASFKSVLPVDMVDSFEAEYKAINYPVLVAAEKEEDKSDYDAMFKNAAEAKQNSEARFAALTDILNNLENNRMGANTSIEQIYEKFPELQAEIDDEIDQHEWGKDIA